MVDAPSEPVVVVDDRGRRTVSWAMQVEDGPVTFTHDFPDAVRHHYEAGVPGEDLLLYAGAFSVDRDDGYAGDVRWRWGRRPYIEVRGHRPTTSNDLRELFDSTEGMWVQPSTLGIELLDGVLPAQPASLPQAEPEMDPPVRPVSSRSLSRRVEQELGTASALHHVTFLVPNGWEGFNGTGICDPTDLKRHWRGRTHAAGGGWQVILDQHADMSTDAWRELQDSAGYRFTHSGRLSRIDGSLFTGAEAFAALDRVRLGLNLALGRRTTCALPVGWRDGKPVWCRWRSAPVDSCSSSSHWLDETIACKQVGEVVSLMLDFTSDEANLAAVQPALAYYVAGNVDVDVELAVAVPLSALQLLSYYTLCRAAPDILAQPVEGHLDDRGGTAPAVERPPGRSRGAPTLQGPRRGTRPAFRGCRGRGGTAGEAGTVDSRRAERHRQDAQRGHAPNSTQAQHFRCLRMGRGRHACLLLAVSSSSQHGRLSRSSSCRSGRQATLDRAIAATSLGFLTRGGPAVVTRTPTGRSLWVWGMR